MLCKKLLSNNLSNGVVQTATRMAELLQKINYLNAHLAQTTSMAKMLNNIVYKQFTWLCSLDYTHCRCAKQNSLAKT